MATNPIISSTASVTGQSLLPSTQIDKAKKESFNSTTSAGHLQQLKQIEHPSEVASLLLSESEGYGKDSKSTLDFNNLIKKFDHIQCGPEDTYSTDSTITFWQSKDEIGGSDFGVLGKVKGEEDEKFVFKTGVRCSAFNQIGIYFFKNDKENARKIAEFIVGDYIRLVHGDKSRHEQDNLKKTLNKELFSRVEIFFGSQEGKTILGKVGKNEINISDLNAIHRSLVSENKELGLDSSLKNVLGVPILMDVINGIAGQQLVNEYQRTYLEEHHMPDAMLALVGSNPLIGSRFLSDAVPFEQFLLECFVPEGKTFEEVRDASKLISLSKKAGAVNADKLEAAKKLISTITTPENHVAAGKSRLIEKLKKERLEGLAASILIRWTMGESLDLDASNMLVVKNKNKGRSQLANIDITGFRHDRRRNFERSKEDIALGWEEQKIMENPDTSLDKLLDKSVFGSRYLRGFDNEAHSIRKVITEALKEAIKKEAPAELRRVRKWYALLDAKPSKLSLADLAWNLWGELDASVKPDEEEIKTAIARNDLFIDAPVRISIDSINAEKGRVVAGSNLRA